MKSSIDRRRFLKMVAATTTAVVAGPMMLDSALAQEAVSANDPTAKALNYVDDAAQATNSPGYKAGSHCGGCMLYQTAMAKDGHAPCGAFGGKLVSEKGWCSAWAAKA